ncbi:MAG: AAA family ATPase [Bacteroidales bacterium]|jgi:hypothetical protein|nr:AAA family ATPase [Bacteroidales bacterium]
METNYQLELARKYVEQTNVNVFLTGKAGTGKTTFLKDIVATLFKRFVVLAPTGVAALNAQGVTIHSFFQLDFAPFIPNSSYSERGRAIKRDKLNIIRSLDLIIIDEISMVRADVLDAVDDILRKVRRNSKPFGGVQMLLIGDLLQLPPVAVDNEWDFLCQYYNTPYFFSSYSLQKSRFVTITLEKVFRQSDERFIDILNSVRDNQITQAAIDKLNERYIPDFKSEENYIQLCTHNYQAKEINDTMLASIKSKTYCYEATVEGEFAESLYPNGKVLELKVGAQVMFIKNDFGNGSKRQYYNGKIGRVIELTDERIVVEDEDKQKIYVHKDTWRNYRYNLNKANRSIEQNIIGTFTQYPLKTAWAITIHKSQGLTFEKAIIDSNKAFANGQVYVALSRCRSLEGLVLSSVFNPYSVKVDYQVTSFNENQQEKQPDEATLNDDKEKYALESVKELFDFGSLNSMLERLYRLNEEDVARFYASAAEKIKDNISIAKDKIVDVSIKFCKQLERLPKNGNNIIKERVNKAQQYFITELDSLNVLILLLQHLEFDNKEINEGIETLTNEIAMEKEIKHRLLKNIEEKDFDVISYVQLRNDLLAQGEKLKLSSITKPENIKTAEKEDIDNHELYEALRQWRLQVSKELNMPAYVVLSQKALINISNQTPTTMKQLATIKGIGKKTMEKYGESIMEIIANNTLIQ